MNFRRLTLEIRYYFLNLVFYIACCPTLQSHTVQIKPDGLNSTILPSFIESKNIGIEYVFRISIKSFCKCTHFLAIRAKISTY